MPLIFTNYKDLIMGNISQEERLARQKQPIDLSANATPAFEELDVITEMPAMSTVDALAFGEEPITIIVSRGAGANAPTSIPIGVNGEQLQVPVGIPVIVKRKFAGAMFSCKSDNIETVVEDMHMDGSVDKKNSMRIWSIPRFAISVIADKSGLKGQQWLSDMMAA